MASISKAANGHRTIQFMDVDEKRKSIRLGKISQRLADSIKLRIEHLVSAKMANHSIDMETARWIEGLEPTLAARLAKVGLIQSRDNSEIPRLGPFLDAYVKSRTDVKPATKEVWGQVVRNLKEFFGEKKDLTEISEGDAEEFKLFLINVPLAATTVSKRLQHATSFLNKARKKRYIERNPFAEVKSAAGNPKDRQFFVTREAIEKVLNICDLTWRMIITLARYGGLRCPSEVLSLKWENIDWESGRVVIESPKTEHHVGKDRRTIPLFPELQDVLEEAFEMAEPGAVYVIEGRYREIANSPKGWKNANLRSQFKRLIKRAGLTEWPRLFQNLRASRETELAQEYPLHVVADWMGNTPQIALKHYLQTTDLDFDRARGEIKSAAKSGAGVVQNAVQHQSAPNRTELQETTKGPSKPEPFASLCESEPVGTKALSGGHGTRTHNPIRGITFPM